MKSLDIPVRLHDERCVGKRESGRQTRDEVTKDGPRIRRIGLEMGWPRHIVSHFVDLVIVCALSGSAPFTQGMRYIWYGVAWARYSNIPLNSCKFKGKLLSYQKVLSCNPYLTMKWHGCKTNAGSRFYAAPPYTSHVILISRTIFVLISNSTWPKSLTPL